MLHFPRQSQAPTSDTAEWIFTQDLCLGVLNNYFCIEIPRLINWIPSHGAIASSPAPRWSPINLRPHRVDIRVKVIIFKIDALPQQTPY
jgi:hypothetical protein